MKAKGGKQLILLAFVLVGFLSFNSASVEDGQQLANQYCGSCHLTPNPKSLTKYIWQLNVLPIMGRYLGVAYMGYDPYSNLNPQEAALLKEQHLYPDEPVIDEKAWQKLVSYYLDNAPASLPLDSARQERDRSLDQFTVSFVPLGKKIGSSVTAIAYDTAQQQLWVAEPDKLYRWNSKKGLTHNYDLVGTVVDIKFEKNRSLLTDVGTLLPSDLSTGTLFSLANDDLVPMKTQIHRPVYSMITDLNDDGQTEILCANYGHRSGSLSLYTKQKSTDSTYTETILFNSPGAVKFYVKDMNGDNRKDIVALFAQNQESIYIFYQTDNLKFSSKKVLQFEPQYGTSDFILLDYNHDGINDIAVVHGDNADYSYCLKPYHGLHLFLGDKNQAYTDAFFYPIYGATRLQADDFDQDGDIDFAISSFFPELTTLSAESFMYLENRNEKKFRFVAHVARTMVPIKSLTLEKADVDNDGDMDLILGQFAYSPVPVPPALQQAWNSVDYKLVILLNQHTD
ncbi:FG-GAP repeat domain-containing protein [Spirosoma sp. KUDC1026]|uniref:FG-GAP repeat domain-containing protein n=1 Tax=Spirosoma sp. KUDC1026 TaxID=2745947 RepID=UPI00159BE828|nr:FG-GAP-like repeat-containing protein [Spirosoma sp. KUDC1026]QKZ12131.1 VCBS repeat-containing protein [Spirosoma sp. KUDC1026]